MKNLIIHLSDIHYDANGAPENQGKVLDAFVDDEGYLWINYLDGED